MACRKLTQLSIQYKKCLVRAENHKVAVIKLAISSVAEPVELGGAVVTGAAVTNEKRGLVVDDDVLAVPASLLEAEEKADAVTELNDAEADPVATVLCVGESVAGDGLDADTVEMAALELAEVKPPKLLDDTETVADAAVTEELALLTAAVDDAPPTVTI